MSSQILTTNRSSENEQNNLDDENNQKVEGSYFKLVKSLVKIWVRRQIVHWEVYDLKLKFVMEE